MHTLFHTDWIQNWCDGKRPAIDVAVTSPFSAQHPANKPPCEYCVEQCKHGKYEKGLKENSDKFWVGLSSLCEMSTH